MNLVFLPAAGTHLSDEPEELIDQMDSVEHAANLFRITQTKDKLKRENVRSQREAIEIHEAVGKAIRKAIEKMGGVIPENIPATGPIKTAESRWKASPSLEKL